MGFVQQDGEFWLGWCAELKSRNALCGSEDLSEVIYVAWWAAKKPGLKGTPAA